MFFGLPKISSEEGTTDTFPSLSLYPCIIGEGAAFLTVAFAPFFIAVLFLGVAEVSFFGYHLSKERYGEY